MTAVGQVANEFLSHKRVAVTGVSRTPKSHGGNIVFNRLKDRGYEVYPVNPNAKTVEGVTAYPNLKAIPGGVDFVIIATRPEHAEATMRECADLGIKRVWMHRLMGSGSSSPDATTFGRSNGITVIEGGCPLMFGPTADGGHKFMRFIFSLTGGVPRQA